MSATDSEHLYDKLVEVFGLDNAITLVLLLQPDVAAALDHARPRTWRTRSDGALAFVPTDQHIEALFDKAVELLGSASGVTLIELLRSPATSALERRRGPSWRVVA